MSHIKQAGFIVLILSLFLLASTIPWTKNAHLEIPFSSSSGYTGNVVLVIPQNVFSGDKGQIIANIEFTNVTGNQETVGIEARLEAGFEELTPGGRVRMNLKTGTAGKFAWSFRTISPSVYPGNLWLWLVEDGKDELILVREFNLESRFYLGQRVINFRIAFLTFIIISVFMFLYQGSHLQRKKI